MRKNMLCSYSYDPLDRLVGCTPSAQASSLRFYREDRLVTETQGSVQCSIFQQSDQLLAQQRHQDDTFETTLLATDQQRSVLCALTTQLQPFSYAPYGHRAAKNSSPSLLGFNGERLDPITGHYLLGNGYRAFNPTLMRFNSPDNLSPFGDGGLNAYAYCSGDPVNRMDPTGHAGNFWKGLQNLFRLRKSSPYTRQTVKNSKSIGEINIFDDKYHLFKKRLNIQAHAIAYTDITVIGPEMQYTPPELHQLLKQHTNLGKYDIIRIISCYTADPPSPFGQELANLTNKPVKAYSGMVYGIERTIAPPNHPKLAGLKIFKSRETRVINGEIREPYKPITFHPQKKHNKAK